MPTSPLVSAIMPTRGRQQWACDAVEMFQRQTWPNKELIVIDDRMDPSFPHGLKREGVEYHIGPRQTIGGKRNLAVSRSHGDIIIHWDSDDIYADDRVEHQVKLLMASGADMVGYNVMHFIREATGQRYEYHGMPGYCIGVSQCYWRETWEARQFPDINQDEDNQFFAGRKAVAVDAEGRITARIHGGNTCDKLDGIKTDPARWRLIA